MKARNFAGCLYEVILDGKKVGLWNFVTSQGCDACKEGYENILIFYLPTFTYVWMYVFSYKFCYALLFEH